MFLWAWPSWGKVIKLCSTDREKCSCSRYLLSLCAYFILYLLCLCYFLQTQRMSAFLSVTWTITSRHSRRRLMRLTWTRTPMLDLPYSPSAPTTGMKVGRVEVNVDVRGFLRADFKSYTLVQVLPPRLQALFPLLCFVWPSFTLKRRKAEICDLKSASVPAAAYNNLLQREKLCICVSKPSTSGFCRFFSLEVYRSARGSALSFCLQRTCYLTWPAFHFLKGSLKSK